MQLSKSLRSKDSRLTRPFKLLYEEPHLYGKEIWAEGAANTRAAPINGHGHISALRSGSDGQFTKLCLFHPNFIIPNPLAPEIFAPIGVLIIDHQQAQMAA
ncbi:hypothetical protein HUJ04_002035 [Dendroctonus ponderosae]|nr:hypothetical protein HUJ04_002035 [Dendroctonus ponderosae]